MEVSLDVEWCDSDGRWSRVAATNADTAVDAVQQVDKAGVAVMVDVILSAGPSLTVGVGRDESVLCFQASDTGPNFGSVGDDDRLGMTQFSYGGAESEFSNRQLISKAQAEAAVREFVGTHVRPTVVDWEEI